VSRVRLHLGAGKIWGLATIGGLWPVPRPHIAQIGTATGTCCHRNRFCISLLPSLANKDEYITSEVRSDEVLVRCSLCLHMVRLMPLLSQNPQCVKSTAKFGVRTELPAERHLPGRECGITASPALRIIGRSHRAGDATYINGRRTAPSPSQHRAPGTVCPTRSVAAHLCLSSSVHSKLTFMSSVFINIVFNYF